MSLPKDLNFDFRAGLDGSSSRNFQCMPSNGSSTNVGGTIRIDLPMEANSYLNGNFTNLKFAVKNPSAAHTITIGSASDLIQSITVYSGSNVIEMCDNFNYLMPLLQSVGGEQDPAKGFENILLGYNGTPVAPTGTVIAVSSSANFTVPLSCLGTIGGNCQKYLPMSGNLRLEVQLAQKVDAVKADAAHVGSPSVEGCALEIQVVSLPYEVAESIREVNGGVIEIGSKQWRSFSAASQAGQTSESLVFPVRCTDLLSAVAIHNNQAGQGDKFSTLNRGKCGLTSYQWRLGTEPLPSTAPVTSPEQFAMLQGAFHGVGSDVCKQISAAAWETETSDDSAVGAYASSLESESFSHSSRVNRGRDTTNLQCFYQPTYSTSIASTVHMYAYCLTRLVLADGIYRNIM